MKNVLQSIMVFLLVLLLFLLAGAYILYEISSPFGFITGFILIMLGLVLAAIIVYVTHDKSKKVGSIRQINTRSDSFIRTVLKSEASEKGNRFVP